MNICSSVLTFILVQFVDRSLLTERNVHTYIFRLVDGIPVTVQDFKMYSDRRDELVESPTVGSRGLPNSGDY